MKTGDYVRTKEGKIGKYDGKYILGHPVWSYSNYKSSPNIIDLIEVGDYVNGYKVLAKEENGLLWVFNNDKHDTLYMNKEDIKSIVTKEQFESMEYKL